MNFPTGASNKTKRQIRIAYARGLGTHTKQEWEDLKKEFFNVCVRCLGKKPVKTICKDHIIPIYQCGSDSIDNIQPICRSCNSSKGRENFNWAEYRRKTGMK